MLDHFRVKGPKFWWIVTSGLTHVLDHRNVTKAQLVLFELDAHACCYLMDALSFDLMKRINYVGTAHEYGNQSSTPSVIHPCGMMASSRRMSPRRRCMSVSSMTIIWSLWKIA